MYGIGWGRGRATLFMRESGHYVRRHIYVDPAPGGSPQPPIEQDGQYLHIYLTGDFLGASVALCHGHAVLSAHGRNELQVYGTAPSPVLRLAAPPDSDETFGARMHMSADYLWIPQHDWPGGSLRNGRLLRYIWHKNTFALDHTWSSRSTNSVFGLSMDADPDTDLAIAAAQRDGQSGSIFILHGDHEYWIEPPDPTNERIAGPVSCASTSIGNLAVYVTRLHNGSRRLHTLRANEGANKGTVSEVADWIAGTSTWGYRVLLRDTDSGPMLLAACSNPSVVYQYRLDSGWDWEFVAAHKPAAEGDSKLGFSMAMARNMGFLGDPAACNGQGCVEVIRLRP
jgi:hypothetical protein